MWRNNSRPSQSMSSPRRWRTRSRHPLWSDWTRTTRQIWDWFRWPQCACNPAPALPVWSPRTRTCSAARRCSGTWPGPAVCRPSRRTWWTVCPTWYWASNVRNLRAIDICYCGFLKIFLHISAFRSICTAIKFTYTLLLLNRDHPRYE